MLSRKAHLALLDIRDCILLAREFTAGLSYEAFEQSRLHFFAATRALEIVSEASRRLPDDVLERHPALPWRAMENDAGGSSPATGSGHGRTRMNRLMGRISV
jgi:uncharacterized protein with HEPN domain